VCGWQVKLCDSLVTLGSYLSALEIHARHYKVLYKSTVGAENAGPENVEPMMSSLMSRSLSYLLMSFLYVMGLKATEFGEITHGNGLYAVTIQ